MTDNADKFYQTAKGLLGQNLAPGNELLGCAISMSAIHNIAFPDKKPLRFVNTTQWYNYMRKSPEWIEAEPFEPNSVVVSVTGQIPKGSPLKNGHIGICGRIQSPDGTNYIMSNNSYGKKWDTHFTAKEWQEFYIQHGQIPTYFFKLI